MIVTSAIGEYGVEVHAKTVPVVAPVVGDCVARLTSEQIGINLHEYVPQRLRGDPSPQLLEMLPVLLTESLQLTTRLHS